MRVGSDDGDNAPVKVEAECYLLARRLGVEINKHGDIFRYFGEHAVDGLEGTVRTLHECATLHVDHGETRGWRCNHAPATARAFGWKVCWTYDTV